MKKAPNVVLKQSDLELGESMETKTIGPIKLKDWPPERSMAIFDCEKEFGFLPQYLNIVKIKGTTSMINVCAIRKVKIDLKLNPVKSLGLEDKN